MTTSKQIKDMIEKAKIQPLEKQLLLELYDKSHGSDFELFELYFDNLKSNPDRGILASIRDLISFRILSRSDHDIQFIQDLVQSHNLQEDIERTLKDQKRAMNKLESRSKEINNNLEKLADLIQLIEDSDLIIKRLKEKQKSLQKLVNILDEL